MRLAVLALAACSATNHGTPDAQPDGSAAEHTTVSALTANTTSASPLFRDDYKNYNVSAQTGSSNGDMIPGNVSDLPLAMSMPVYVETQTWFCHLASNESSGRLLHDAHCGSHIDVGYNSDDPAQVARQIADLKKRGVAGVIMDWSGKDSRHDADPSFYPTANGTNHTSARSSGEIATNTIYLVRDAGIPFAVVEDEGITNCRKGWNGGCACWAAYGTTCNETSQVISDLSYIAAHWATAPSYMKIGGKPVVLFFAPDYNACPDPKAADCQTIDWTAVHSFVGDQVWIFENKGGATHAFSDGAFGWLATTLYPGSDPTYGLAYLKDYDHNVHGHVFASSFKGFDDGVTDGWNFADGSHTRYIAQRCGQTWLDTLAQTAADFASGAEALQLVTWDDYEEATELETGIDTCVTSIDAHVDGTQLAWTITFGKDLTGVASGSERTIDHYTVWASPDGEQLVKLADVTGAHALDLAAHPPPPGTRQLFVQAVAKPFLVNALSAPAAL